MSRKERKTAVSSKRNRFMDAENIRCSRCALPIDWGITKFDEQGVCNYCRYYDTVRDKLRDFDRLKQLFLSHLNQHKGKYEYDVVVGFSGGKDSSYIVHTLKKHYQCRVLAVTVDFGFMPSGPAKENMKRVAKSLEIDHLIYDASANHLRQGFRNAILKARFCGFCTALCWLIPRKIAVERHIPFYIMGSDRGQMFRDLSPETAPMSGADSINFMMTPYSDEKTLRGDHPTLVPRMRSFLASFGLPAEVCQEIYPAPEYLPTTQAMPFNLQFFLFHPYREKEIKAILTAETNWQKPTGDHLHSHHDCILHDAIMHLFRACTATTLTASEICVDVREGEIAREEAIEALKTEAARLDNLSEPYRVFQECFNISEQEMRRVIKRFRRRMEFFRRLRKLQLLFCRPKLRLLDEA